MGYVHGHWRETGWVRGHFRHPLRPGAGQIVLRDLPVVTVPAPRPPSDPGGGRAGTRDAGQRASGSQCRTSRMRASQ